MGFLYVILSTFSNSLSYVFEKYFTKKCVFFFTAVCQLFCAIAFLILSKFSLNFNACIIPYAISIMLLATVNSCALIVAMQRGDLSITGLISSLSLIVTTILSIIFLDGKPSVFFIIGFVILVFAMIFINVDFSKKTQSAEEKPKKKFDLLWLILSLSAMVANGISSFLVAKQERTFNGQFNNEIMVIAFLGSFVLTLVVSLIFERGESLKLGYKSASIFGSLSGISLGLCNIFVLFSVAKMSASIVFSVISGGSMTLIFIASILLFKEKYKFMQYVGFILSIISLALLSI